MVNEQCIKLYVKFRQDQVEFQRWQTETQGEVEKIAGNLQTLTQQLNDFKPISEGILGEIKGEVTTGVSDKLSKIELKVTQLTTEVAKQSKIATKTTTTVQDLLISVENLSKYLIRMQKYTPHGKGAEAMEAESVGGFF